MINNNVATNSNKHLLKKTLLALAITSAAASGSAEQLPGSNEQLKSTVGLEEIVVTATRRSESLQEVPLAVSAISGDDLAKGGVFETSDLDRISPNLSVSSPYGSQQPNFSIRGVGVGTEFNANAASPVGVYVDEVYQTFRASHGQQLFDLKQIEVVRGPQGTLYGRNTTGGAINFITRKPELADSNGTLTLGYGDYNRKSIVGAYEFTPMTDKLGIRVAGTYVETDPMVENRLPAAPSTAAAGGASGLNFNTGTDPAGHENYGIRATVRFVPSDTVDLMLKVYSAESKGGTEAPIPTGSDKNSDTIDFTNPNFLLGPLFQGLAPSGLVPANYSQSANGHNVREIEVDSLSSAKTTSEGIVFSAEIDLNDNLSLIAITGYDSGEYLQLPTTDCDGTPLALCSIGYNSDFEAFNLDVRFDYSNGPLKLIVGGFYGEDTLTSDNKPNFFNFLRDVNAAVGSPAGYFNPGGAFNGAGLSAASLPTGITATQHFKQDRESYAIYGEANYELTDTITLTTGLRYSSDDLEFSEGVTTYFDDTGVARLLTVSNYQQGGSFSPYFLEDVLDEAGNVVIPAALASPGPVPGGLEQKGSSSKTSGRIIIDWKPTEEMMLYASFSRGYRAGTINGLAYGSADQVYFVEPEEVDAYEVGFKSRLMDNQLQVNGSVFYYDYTGQQGQVVDASATANLISLDGEITGLELDIQYAATDKLTLTASAGYLDSEYANGDCPSTPINGFPAQQGSCVVSSGGAASVGGNPFPYAPKTSYNVGFDWQVMAIGEGTVTLHADAAYKGQYYYDSFKDYSRGPLPSVASGKFGEGEGKYWISNARLSYDTEKYSISAWGKNLTDEEYYPFGISLENLFGNGYRVIGQPRTYGAEIQFFF